MPVLQALRDRLATTRPGRRLLAADGPRISPAQRVIAVLVPPLVTAVAVRDYRGGGHVPARGGVIVAANHISDADPFVLVDFLLRSGRHVHLLAKAALFGVPVVGWFLHSALMIPVRRQGVTSARSLDEAVRALRAGAAVGIYPEGKESLDPTYWPMNGRDGLAALAVTTGCPVIPVAQWGTQHIRGQSTVLHLFPRTRVVVRAGPPVDLAAWQGAPFTEEVLDAVTDRVMGAILDLEQQVRDEAPPAPVRRGRPGWLPDRAAWRGAHRDDAG